MLRVTVYPARSWLVVILELGVLAVFAAMVYQSWAKMSQVLRGGILFAEISAVIGLIFQLAGTETVVIDTSKITLCKDIHGWERKREYGIKECRELEWMENAEDTPQRLQFKVGWRTVTFGRNLGKPGHSDSHRTSTNTA